MHGKRRLIFVFCELLNGTLYSNPEFRRKICLNSHYLKKYL